MSKKTKRLEKENMNLTRKHDLTNQNILKMAEERTKTNVQMDDLQKKNAKLTSIINQMQQQGRGMASGLASGLANSMAEGALEGEYAEGDLEEDSEYDYGEEEGEDGGDASEEYDDEDTEEEANIAYGPPPPPDFLPTTNGTAPATNGIAQH